MKGAIKAGVLLGFSACLLCPSGAFAQSAGHAATGDYGWGYRLSQFDTNHDGKVTHDELNRAIAVRFLAATHGAPAMSQDQFVSLRTGDAPQRIAQAFRRLDWNGDGKLSFDEYAGPERARFEALDRDGKGAESCAQDAVQNASYRPATSRRSSFGRARFCAANDLNHDGMVSHAEFDSVEAKRFASAASGSKTMTLAQFIAETLARYRQSDTRIFMYLDRDRDGRLSLAEYAASDEKLFARLDRNGDGVVTRDEMASGASSYPDRNRRQTY